MYNIEDLNIVKLISIKVMNYCISENISINEFSLRCCLTQSTIQNIINVKNKNIKLLTIIRICDGIGISLSDFFNDNIFDHKFNLYY